MSTKQILLEVAQAMPPDARLCDVVVHLEGRIAVEEGLAALDRGEFMDIEEARNLIPLWIAEYRSQTKA